MSTRYNTALQATPDTASAACGRLRAKGGAPERARYVAMRMLACTDLLISGLLAATGSLEVLVKNFGDQGEFVVLSAEDVKVGADLLSYVLAEPLPIRRGIFRRVLGSGR